MSEQAVSSPADLSKQDWKIILHIVKIYYEQRQPEDTSKKSWSPIRKRLIEFLRDKHRKS